MTLAHGAPSIPDLGLPSPSWSVDLTRVCLPNGLLLEVVHRPEVGTVSITSVIGGGHSAETAETRGSAHLTEHLWFQSRPDGGARPWDLKAGIRTQAVTQPDATVYDTVGSPSDLTELLRLEVARIRDPLQGVTEADVTAERRVVASELQWRGSHGDRAAMRWLDVALWPAEHPYAATVTELEEAGALDLAKVKAYAAAAYTPANTALRIEGAVEAEQVLEVLGTVAPPEWYQGTRRACDRKPTPAGPPLAAPDPRIRRIEAALWRPLLFVGWTLPPAGGPDDTRMQLAVAVLDEVVRRAVGFSRVGGADRVVQQCSLIPGHLASKVVCTVEFPSEAEAGEGVGLIRSTLDHQWSLGETQMRNPVIRRAAGDLFLGAFENLDRFDEDALDDRAFATWQGSGDPTEEVVDTVFSVQADELTALARKWLGPERMAGVLLVPGAARMAGGASELDADLFDFPELPPWKPAPLRFFPVSERLPNGLSVWSLQRTDAPYLAYTALVGQGGWATSPIPGTTEVLEYVEYPTFPMPWGDVTDKVPHDLDFRYGSRSHEFHLEGPAQRIDVALWAQHHLIDMSIDMESRQQAVDRALDPVIPMFGAVSGLTEAAMREEWVLGRDRASRPWWVRLGDAKAVGEAQVSAWRRAIWRPSNAVLVVTSPIDPAQARSLAADRLGDWKEPKKGVTPANEALSAPPEAHTWLVPSDSVLTWVNTTCRVPPRTDQNAAAYAVLGGVVDRALFQSLREGLGLYATGVSFDFVDGRAGLLEIQAAAPPDQAVLASKTVLNVLAGVSAGVPEPAVAWGRLQASGELSAQLASAAGGHGLLLAAAREGRTLEGLKAMRSGFAEVQSATLASLVKDCVGHEAVTLRGPIPEGAVGERLDWAARDRAIGEALR